MIADFRMSHVTFRISLALQVLHQVADDYASIHPETAKEIKQSFYVDDILTEAAQAVQGVKTFAGQGLTTLSASYPLLVKAQPQMARPWDFTGTLDKSISTYQKQIFLHHLLLPTGLLHLQWPEYLMSRDGLHLLH